MRESKIEPEVGMGATLIVGSDNYPYTITEVVRDRISGRVGLFTMREDVARRIDQNGLSESQEYEYESDEQGNVSIVRRRKDGSWRVERSHGNGTGYVHVGSRRKYRDPSF